MIRLHLYRLAAVVMFVVSARAELRLPKILSSHMVLQRLQPVHVWGWADPAESVSATLNGSSQTVTADDVGLWEIYLAPLQAGGPYQLTVKGSANTITLEDVMIGDVWFASGQSNMEMPLKGFVGNAVIQNSAEEIKNATQPNIRLLRIKTKSSTYPLNDFNDSWTACTPETAEDFSAVAYFFGRNIANEEHVPIGLIDSSWGGTPAEAWTSLDGLASDASLMPVFAGRAQMVKNQATDPLHKEQERKAIEAAKAAKQPSPKFDWRPAPESWAPAGLYNAMVAPAIRFPIKGAIWYQGESNAGADRSILYEKLFETMISDWRMKWGIGNFPFFFVQLANYNAVDKGAPTWPIVREAQRRTLSLINTGMAVTVDIGDPGNVHPSNKQDVGIRLALAARSVAYGEKIEYSGPMFRQISLEPNAIRVWFDHVASGLVANGPIQGFEVAGQDGGYKPAQASVDGATVIVTSKDVPQPRSVRYGWQNSPVVNLFNSEHLPASPFTSEETIPKP